MPRIQHSLMIISVKTLKGWHLIKRLFNTCILMLGYTLDWTVFRCQYLVDVFFQYDMFQGYLYMCIVTFVRTKKRLCRRDVHTPEQTLKIVVAKNCQKKMWAGLNILAHFTTPLSVKYEIIRNSIFIHRKKTIKKWRILCGYIRVVQCLHLH